MRISAYDRPQMFRDELVRGPLRRLVHDHFFEQVGQGTEMRDAFEFESAVRKLDALVLVPRFRRLLLRRNETIKRLAESADSRASTHVPHQRRDPRQLPCSIERVILRARSSGLSLGHVSWIPPLRDAESRP